MAETGATARDPEAATGSTFVGRDRDLHELLAGLDDAVAGRGRLFLIGGEPGIGKSRLADELAVIARQRGYRAVSGRAWEDAGAPAYWPWMQVFRAHMRGTDGNVVRRQLGLGAADLVQILPEIATIVPDVVPASGGDPDAARFRLFDSAATFLINITREAPLVILLDDLHAADTASLLFLRFVASQLADSRLLVVATYRSLELTHEHPLSAALIELAREPATRVLTLEGLGEAAVTDLIKTLAGMPLPPGAVSAIWRETSGNPLFLSEAVRFLSATGQLERVTELGSLKLSVPARIRDVIARRVALLGPDATQALQYGAAFGPEFNIDHLRRVAPTQPADMTSALASALQAGFLITAGGGDRLRFSHGLVRESLHDSLEPTARTALHRQIGEFLEREYGAAAREHLAELAYHFFEAAPAGGDGRTIDYCQRAGEQAVSSLAYEEAARFFGMALQALGSRRAALESQRGALLLLLGDTQARAGDLAGARATFLRAASMARQSGDAMQLARAALGYGGRFIWSRAGDDPHLVPLLHDAIAMLAGADEQLQVRLQGRLACAWRSSPEHFGDCAELSQQALELARRLSDPATLSYALLGRFWATMWPENPAERLDVATELLAVAEGVGDPERMIDGHHAVYVAYLELGRIAEAKAQVAIAARLAVELRQPTPTWAMRTCETTLALAAGDFERASELVELELGSPSINSIRDDVSNTRMHRFLLRREQGRLAEEETAVRASAIEFPWYPFHRAALALLLLDLGRADEARVVFNDLARDDFRALYRDCEWLFGMGMASEACALLGDATAAAVLYRQLLPFAGRHAVAHSEGSIGAVDRYLGLLASAGGRFDDAERHFNNAIAVSERLGVMPWLARTQFDLAQMLARRSAPGDAERAAVCRDAAREIAQRLGMSALLGVLEPALEVAPVSAAPPRRSARTGTFRREGEYWTVGLDDSRARVRDAKGMRYLSLLLARPGAEMHALDIVGAERGSAGSSRPPRAATSELDGIGFGDAGEMLDAEARQAYRERLRELDADIAQAEEWNDPERVNRLQSERQFLVRELAAAVGLGGRSRVAASAAERARLNVGKAIRAAIQRIHASSPALAAHLGVAVHTGTFCSYMPDPGLSISWEL